MWGPQLKNNLIDPDFQDGSTFDVNQCDALFETSFTQTDANKLDTHYLKWADVKCNQKTRAQICTILGITTAQNLYFKY